MNKQKINNLIKQQIKSTLELTNQNTKAKIKSRQTYLIGVKLHNQLDKLKTENKINKLNNNKIICQQIINIINTFNLKINKKQDILKYIKSIPATKKLIKNCQEKTTKKYKLIIINTTKILNSFKQEQRLTKKYFNNWKNKIEHKNLNNQNLKQLQKITLNIASELEKLNKQNKTEFFNIDAKIQKLETTTNKQNQKIDKFYYYETSIKKALNTITKIIPTLKIKTITTKQKIKILEEIEKLKTKNKNQQEQEQEIQKLELTSTAKYKKLKLTIHQEKNTELKLKLANEKLKLLVQWYKEPKPIKKELIN